MGSVTMTTVAREAGVSVSTVSHVVNGTRPVAPETKRLVLEAMEKVGFTHRPVARSLAAGSTTTIGVAMSFLASIYGQELVAGIEEEALRHGMQLLFADTRDDAEREGRVIANLLAHHVAGMIIMPSPSWTGTALRLLNEHDTPFVVVDRHQDLDVDQVCVENEQASAAIVDHLLQIGHTRVGFIDGMAGLATSAERRDGYLLAHKRRGVPVDESLMVNGGSTEHDGRKAMQHLLAMPAGTAPTAVFVSNDAMSIGAVRALRQAGMRIPDDMALVCFDEFPWGDLLTPHLTTIAQPCYALGARAVQLLLRRLQQPEVPGRTIRLAGEISHGTSCGCRGISGGIVSPHAKAEAASR
ncbi:LacI family transcriptional regulator [Dermatophilus congolensis]|uniref:Catabolite control protein n=3 Tax=Dermatophilus congolensis TaxID=1863 RepID=A0A239V9W8_9MICO|nr:LacI family DNA-binding transcriptional regulator [Dermatophilus congolensis]MBO3130608.1 LacI family transcriptional regulator [Dermatophilus congolensis]MBO3130762.1 LacI family transcriptional regulator [Dermatophilus congolensis]MBO3135081.1 LacI family transcriptional regulator [Dermatophilus congolensis]MBO3137320.1 LacI family transcriptional regulator [Dermatophilus congolensis]MBO3139562.1 LacI family transcriptional regulator [Dermatophilus congolensis]